MEDKKMTLTDQPIDNNPMVDNPDIPAESLYEFTDNKVSSLSLIHI